MTSRSVTVANRLGLHARAAARFVHLASRFQSQVRVTRGAQTMDGKSIMGILLLAAAAIVTAQRVNAEWAVHQVFDELASVFDSVEDPYLKERKGDLADIVGRLRMNLAPGGSGFRELLKACEAPCVLVADELPPSVAAQLDWTKIQAFVTDAGSRTYHTAILARSLHVPAVVGLHDAP